MLRHILGIHPDTVFLAVEFCYLNRLAVLVIGIDEGRLILVHLIVLKVYRRLSVSEGDDVNDNIASHYCSDKHNNNQQTHEHDKNRSAVLAGLFIFILRSVRIFSARASFCASGVIVHLMRLLLKDDNNIRA